MYQLKGLGLKTQNLWNDQKMSGKIQILGDCQHDVYLSWSMCILVSELIHINAYMINNSNSFVLSEWTIIMLMYHI